MKTKTLVTLSADVLVAVDKLAGKGGSRSAVIEAILRDFVRRRQRAARDNRDLEALNKNAARLNAEAADVLAFQSWPGE